MNKKRITFTLDEKTINALKDYSKKSMIPQARLVEECILIMLKKKGYFK